MKDKVAKFIFRCFNCDMFINIFNFNNNLGVSQKQSFEGRLPKKVFFDIRDIPKLTCAKCGNELISIPERDEFLDTFGAVAKKTLANPVFDDFRQFNAFKFLKNLSERHPRTSLSQIVKNKIVEHKILKFTDFDKKLIKEVIDISKDYTQKSPQVIKKLYPLRAKLPDEYKDLIDYMYMYSLLYPKNTFSEIFNKKEVWSYHDKLRTLQKEKFHHASEIAFNNLNKLCERLPESQREEFNKLNIQANTIISYQAYPSITKKIMLNDLYKDFWGRLEDKALAKKIQRQIEKLPYNNLSGSNLIIENLKSSDREIIKNIIDNLSSTFEHVVPHSQKGSRAKGNGICLCKKCNLERATIPYTTMMQSFPMFQENLQKQINKVISFILHRKLKSYENYPQNIKKTLLDVTDQKLRIDIKNFIITKHKNIKNEIEEAERKLDENQKLFKQTQLVLKEKKEYINRLYDELVMLQNSRMYLKTKLNKKRKSYESILNLIRERNKDINRVSKELKKVKLDQKLLRDIQLNNLQRINEIRSDIESLKINQININELISGD